jgi:aromatic ring-opening dioxygenase LigB subunit
LNHKKELIFLNDKKDKEINAIKKGRRSTEEKAENRYVVITRQHGVSGSKQI